MMAPIVSGVLLAAALACVLMIVMRQRFATHLDTLEAEIRKPGSAPNARSDLPAEVIALAARTGAHAASASGFAAFEQSGQMWRTPGGKPMDFTARQTVRVAAPGFLWRAAIGSIVAADYFVAGIGGLEVKLWGAIPLARMVGGASAAKGEALRYLAELPWNPDAILVNGALDWTVLDAKTIKVATGMGAERGEVTFDLDDNGLIVRAGARSRPYAEKDGRMTAHPWRGRFWDYQPMGDRLIPTQGEVAWVLDAGDFVYWRGRILGWRGCQ
jgi:hypothetical protein